MVDGLKEAQAKAGAKFEKDQQAAQDGAEARAKHEAEARAVDEKTARLIRSPAEGVGRDSRRLGLRID
jgi:hypothetical protein